jgi:hypothetical protein
MNTLICTTQTIRASLQIDLESYGLYPCCICVNPWLASSAVARLFEDQKFRQWRTARLHVTLLTLSVMLSLERSLKEEIYESHLVAGAVSFCRGDELAGLGTGC